MSTYLDSPMYGEKRLDRVDTIFDSLAPPKIRKYLLVKFTDFHIFRLISKLIFGQVEGLKSE